ncbi:uncharacterized protein LOC111316285 [Durio zibethinus]|uniref:Uncharacterized protein LOC111316285 n=1 Tax=Durio zibethinus TaxID=66656 RepID=A0A6P6BAA8_DURZI|nr:uncharacterized protein LOC111316285 [Durio zibethinus]
MNSDHFKQAIQECSLLQAQGLIEPTSSPWACEAFYVNKRSEQVREKLRLIINYKSLNIFLADDKFSLPNRKTLFANLANAKWTVIPFGLKVAHSLFQKAMTKIFTPILDNALIYIEILLFSPYVTSHTQLLDKFQ